MLVNINIFRALWQVQSLRRLLFLTHFCDSDFLKVKYLYRQVQFSNLIFFLKHRCVCVKAVQSCPTLCDSMDQSLPVSSVHGILQARILEWVQLSILNGLI